MLIIVKIMFMIPSYKFSLIKWWALTSCKTYNRRSTLPACEALTFISLGHILIQVKHFPLSASSRRPKYENGRVWSNCQIEARFWITISPKNWNCFHILKNSCEQTIKSIVLCMFHIFCKIKLQLVRVFFFCSIFKYYLKFYI